MTLSSCPVHTETPPVATIEQAIETTLVLSRFCARMDMQDFMAHLTCGISAYRDKSKCCPAGAYGSYLAEAAARIIYAGEAS